MILDSFPADFCTRAAAVIAIFIGVVAIGTERRQRWVVPLAGHLFGTGAKRVRGYLKPVDTPGRMTARPNVGLENPGLDSVRVGAGTPYINNARDTVVMFVGTKDGSAPELRVEKGTVKVQGEVVEEWKLEDGDLIEIEGFAYRYCRGQRR